MSPIEPTDLLCRARRDELTTDEQRRLDTSLACSLDVRLMNEMLSEFERESSVRSGDDLLLARITTGALGAARRAPARKRWRPRLSTVLIAAALLLIASLAGAWLSGARARKVRPPAVSESIPSAGKSARVALPRKPALAKANRDEVAPQPAPMATSEPPERASSAGPTRVERATKTNDPSSASELFARANLLRRQGRGVSAVGLYQRLLELYPNSREVGPTHLVLGKYYQAAQPERALVHYRAVARTGGALRAEALWGMSEVANRLGERSLAEQTRLDLLREYPDSPYAEVARSRAGNGLP